MHIKREKKKAFVVFFLKVLTAYLLKEVNWVTSERKWQVASRWELGTSVVSYPCPSWVPTRVSFVLRITPRAQLGPEQMQARSCLSVESANTQGQWCRLVVGVHASFLPAERERTHSTCSGVRPVYTVITNQNLLTYLNQQGASVLHGYSIWN